MTLKMSRVDVQQVKKRIFEMVFDKSKNFSLIPLLNLYTTLRRIQSELGNTLDICIIFHEIQFAIVLMKTLQLSILL